MAMPNPPSFLNIGTDLVTVEIAQSGRKFKVHRDLLICESPYFSAMFKGAWKEATAQTPIPLDPVGKGIFPHFLDWLYFRRIPTLASLQAGSSQCGNCGGDCADTKPQEICYEIKDLTGDDDAKMEQLLQNVSQYNVWTHLYIFADSFDFPSLRELIISRTWQHYAPESAVQSYVDDAIAFRWLSTSSPLCRLYTDIYAMSWHPPYDQNCLTEQKLRAKLPANFYFIVAAKARARLSGHRVETIEPICNYHEHARDNDAKELCKQQLMLLPEDPVATYKDWDEMEEKRAERFREEDE